MADYEIRLRLSLGAHAGQPGFADEVAQFAANCAGMRLSAGESATILSVENVKDEEIEHERAAAGDGAPLPGDGERPHPVL